MPARENYLLVQLIVPVDLKHAIVDSWSKAPHLQNDLICANIQVLI